MSQFLGFLPKDATRLLEGDKGIIDRITERAGKSA
jgi:hypothetical protein